MKEIGSPKIKSGIERREWKALLTFPKLKSSLEVLEEKRSLLTQISNRMAERHLSLISHT